MTAADYLAKQYEDSKKKIAEMTQPLRNYAESISKATNDSIQEIQASISRVKEGARQMKEDIRAQVTGQRPPRRAW